MVGHIFRSKEREKVVEIDNDEIDEFFEEFDKEPSHFRRNGIGIFLGNSDCIGSLNDFTSNWNLTVPIPGQTKQMVKQRKGIK